MNSQDFDLDTVKYFFEHDYHDRGMMKWHFTNCYLILPQWVI
ncbi:DNA-directed RNA polymerase beta subunit [Lactiplantibacillus plantarum]|nr:DNA-directed RNA polymerase beta subunit [Lactiplantibacillus plantarum]KZU67241.1 DNA-directed RNA polymerase beta subunit [Lactiplantibacillus plantarum]